MTRWIRGRFEGTYVGRIVPTPPLDAEQSEPIHINNIRIERGMVRDCIDVDEPSDAQPASDKVIRQRALLHTLFPPDADELTWRPSPLYDLRITDWKLVSPAIADGRAFGTVVGTVVARLDPFEDVPAKAPVEADEKDANISTETVPKVSPTPDGSGAKIVEAPAKNDGLGWAWWLAIVGVVGVTLALCLFCGAPTGMAWGGAMGIALMLRRTFGNIAARDGLGWRLLGIAIVAGHGALLWPPVNAWYQTGCKPALGNSLVWLALPVLAAAPLPRKLPLLLTSALWTIAMFTWCSQLKGAACGLPKAAATEVAAVAPNTRVDRAGRWPRRPGGGRMPQGAFDIGQARETKARATVPRVPLGGIGGVGIGRGRKVAGDRSAKRTSVLPDSVSPEMENPGRGPIGSPPRREALEFLAGDDSRSSGEGEPAQVGEGDAQGTDHAGEGSGGSGGRAEPLQGQAGRASGRGQPGNRNPGTHGTSAESGSTPAPMPGGVARGEMLSLDQVEAQPERFFEASGLVRIYIPTDEFFGADGDQIAERQSGELGVLAGLLRQHPRAVTIEVFTDARRSAKDMRQLAQARADAVVRWLGKHDVDRDLLTGLGVGSAKPIVPPLVNRVHQSANRRLEIKLTGSVLQ